MPISTLDFNLKLITKSNMDFIKVSFSSVESLNVDDIEVENDSVFGLKRDEGEREIYSKKLKYENQKPKLTKN